jgi:hypothetical protein
MVYVKIEEPPDGEEADKFYIERPEPGDEFGEVCKSQSQEEDEQ